MKKLACLILLGLALIVEASATSLHGTISDETGQTLPYASIYIKNTTIGTSSNVEGHYEFDLKPGVYEVVYSYIGYQERVEKVTIGAEDVRLDVVLLPIVTEMGVIEVVAGEDPAYRIIREAQKKRQFHLNQVEQFQCMAYVKGNIALNKTPKKFMGQDMGDMKDQMGLDSTGMMYLSESYTKYSRKKPNGVKEEMISSKVSGDNQGFSFNTASGIDFNFYQNQLDLNRPITSPIAENAMTFYKYFLISSNEVNGVLVHKIKVVAKREYDPVFHGHIFITEGSFRIHSLELVTGQKETKINGLDSLVWRQTHIPVANDVWMPFNQNVRFYFGMLGFGFKGDFIGIFSDYNLNPNFPKDYFGNEVIKVEEGSNKKNEVYWDSIRPIPLTVLEATDYKRKDSISVVHNSKVYLDSIDKVNNKFKLMPFITNMFRYSHSNSYKKSYWSAGLDLDKIHFNTVQGMTLGANARYTKYLDKDEHKRLSMYSGLEWAFSENIMRGTGQISYQMNRTNYATITIEGGREAKQFNRAEAIGPFVNELYSLFGRKNYMKLFDLYFVEARYRQEIVNGLNGQISVSYEKRNALTNNTNFAWVDEKSDRMYSNNDPLYDDYSGPYFQNHDMVKSVLSLRYQPGQKYMRYPKRKINMGSKWPELKANYSFNYNTTNKEKFHKISLGLDYDWKMGLVGESEISVEAGKFFGNNPSAGINFMDFKHFNGNQTMLGKPGGSLGRFMLLEYYRFSTNDSWAEWHYAHDFNGFIFNKIPLIKKLGFTEVIGYRGFMTPGLQKPYHELSVGIDKIGFGIFRILRVDWAIGFYPDGTSRNGFVFSLAMPIGRQ